MKKSDCVIIGAGIAGLTAAIYLKRANVDFMIIEKSAPGGVLNRTSKVDNYPGVINADGVELAMKIYEQVQQLEVNYHYGDVKKITLENNQPKIITEKEEILAKTIIIASGRIPRELGLPNEKSLIGRGISWCAICDGYMYKEKTVGVVGSGNSAFEEALYLANIAKEVYLLYNPKKVLAEEGLFDKIKKTKNIKLVPGLQIKELIKDEKLKAIRLTNDQIIDLEGLFLFIGYEPLLACIKDLDIKRDNGYLVVDQKMQTSIPNIFACGDVIKKDVYQLTTAVGEAAIAATFVKKQLDLQ